MLLINDKDHLNLIKLCKKSNVEWGGSFEKRGGKLYIKTIKKGGNYGVNIIDKKSKTLFHTHPYKNVKEQCNKDFPSAVDIVEIVRDSILYDIKLHIIVTSTKTFYITSKRKTPLSLKDVESIDKKMCWGKITLNSLIDFFKQKNIIIIYNNNMNVVNVDRSIQPKVIKALGLMRQYVKDMKWFKPSLANEIILLAEKGSLKFYKEALKSQRLTRDEEEYVKKGVDQINSYVFGGMNISIKRILYIVYGIFLVLAFFYVSYKMDQACSLPENSALAVGTSFYRGAQRLAGQTPSCQKNIEFYKRMSELLKSLGAAPFASQVLNAGKRQLLSLLSKNKKEAIESQKDIDRRLKDKEQYYFERSEFGYTVKEPVFD